MHRLGFSGLRRPDRPRSRGRIHPSSLKIPLSVDRDHHLRSIDLDHLGPESRLLVGLLDLQKVLEGTSETIVSRI